MTSVEYACEWCGAKRPRLRITESADGTRIECMACGRVEWIQKESEHTRLVDLAREAIRAVIHNRGVELGTTIDSLEEIRDDLDMQIDTLKADLRAKDVNDE